MATAEALFKRHISEYVKVCKNNAPSETVVATIYAACIVAEAIRHGLDES